MAEWWEFIPIVSTMGHIVQEPKGTDWSDYESAAVTRQESVDPFDAKLQCEKRIDQMMLSYIRSYVGVALPADMMKFVGSLALSNIIEVVLIKLGKTKAASAVASCPLGFVIAIDGVADAGVIISKIGRIYDAAQVAKNRFV